MMTIASLTLLTWSSFFFLAFSGNPLFMSMNLMMAAIFGLTLAALTCLLSWYPLILGMLFLGGILVTFMILCSLMPNEKIKVKSLNWVLLFTPFIFLFSCVNPSESVFKSNKTYIEETPSYFFVLGIMLLYFLAFVIVVSEQMHPMRTLWCLRTEVL